MKVDEYEYRAVVTLSSPTRERVYVMHEDVTLQEFKAQIAEEFVDGTKIEIQCRAVTLWQVIDVEAIAEERARHNVDGSKRR